MSDIELVLEIKKLESKLAEYNKLFAERGYAFQKAQNETLEKLAVCKKALEKIVEESPTSCDYNGGCTGYCVKVSRQALRELEGLSND